MGGQASGIRMDFQVVGRHRHFERVVVTCSVLERALHIFFSHQAETGPLILLPVSSKVV
jgi:hypothetical protein